MSFQQGLSGLDGASKALDTIGNNIANSGTSGFKAAAAQFADVFAASLAGGGGSQVGVGVGLSAISQEFTQGNITTTGNPLDIAINGAGMFRLSDNGTITYSRNGQFNLDKNGYITNGSGARLTGYAVDAAGVVVPGSFADLQVNASNIAPRATSGAQVQLTLDSRAAAPTITPFSAANVATYTGSTSQTVYDSLGNSHNMTMYFVKSATAGQYNMYTSLDGGAAAGPTALNFSNTGTLTTAMPVTQSFALTNGAASPLAFPLDLTGSVQYGVSFGVNQLVQDGYTSGRLTGVNVSADGIVQGRYSNGQTQNLGQVALVNFNNPNGLQQLGGSQWAETSESGQPIPGSPGQGSLGAVQSGAVEESNVDLTSELVNMITQQRAYQANAQTIKTQDSVLQTLVNLR
jgi:flagellar hook protein FlgE